MTLTLMVVVIFIGRDQGCSSGQMFVSFLGVVQTMAVLYSTDVQVGTLASHGVVGG